MGRDHPDLCFWICWNWAIAKHSECLSQKLGRWNASCDDEARYVKVIKDGWDCVRLFPFALHLAMDSAGR